jgi:2-keto-4-pentenoate hydratase
VESEVAVELGDDARSIVALLPALELADPPDLEQDVETILAGNIFHRAVAFGPRVETDSPGAARILVNGSAQHEVEAERAGANLAAMVEAVASRLEAAGERLRPGERIITGVLAPPHKAEPGDTVRLELETVGAVELRFAP